jgi:hypothetical protein
MKAFIERCGLVAAVSLACIVVLGASSMRRLVHIFFIPFTALPLITFLGVVGADAETGTVTVTS